MSEIEKDGLIGGNQSNIVKDQFNPENNDVVDVSGYLSNSSQPEETQKPESDIVDVSGYLSNTEVDMENQAPLAIDPYAATRANPFGQEAGVQSAADVGYTADNIEDFEEIFDGQKVNLQDRDETFKKAAEEQSGWRLAKNAVMQSVTEVTAGTLEGVGYLLDFPQLASLLIPGTQKEEEFGNWFSDEMKAIKDSARETGYNVYQTEDAQDGFAPGDATWWASNAPSIVSTFSMMIPALGATKLAGVIGGAVAKGVRAASIAGKGGKIARTASNVMASPITKAIMETGQSAFTSRYIENTMEAAGATEEFKQQYSERWYRDNPGKNMTQADIDDMNEQAGEAGRKSWYSNLSLLAMDVAQFGMMFKSFKNVSSSASKMSTAARLKELEVHAAKVAGKEVAKDAAEKGIMSKVGDVARKYAKKGGNFLFQSATEGAEEGYQFFANKAAVRSQMNKTKFQNEFLSNPDDFKDPELWTSVFFGALGGGLFSALGPVVSKIADRTKTGWTNGPTLEQKIQEVAVSSRAAALGDEVSYGKIVGASIDKLAQEHARNGKIDDLIGIMELQIQNGNMSEEDIKSTQANIERVKQVADAHNKAMLAASDSTASVKAAIFEFNLQAQRLDESISKHKEKLETAIAQDPTNAKLREMEAIKAKKAYLELVQKSGNKFYNTTEGKKALDIEMAKVERDISKLEESEMPDFKIESDYISDDVEKAARSMAISELDRTMYTVVGGKLKSSPKFRKEWNDDVRKTYIEGLKNIIDDKILTNNADQYTIDDIKNEYINENKELKTYLPTAKELKDLNDHVDSSEKRKGQYINDNIFDNDVAKKNEFLEEIMDSADSTEFESKLRNKLGGDQAVITAFVNDHGYDSAEQMSSDLMDPNSISRKNFINKFIPSKISAGATVGATGNVNPDSQTNNNSKLYLGEKLDEALAKMTSNPKNLEIHQVIDENGEVVDRFYFDPNNPEKKYSGMSSIVNPMDGEIADGFQSAVLIGNANDAILREFFDDTSGMPVEYNDEYAKHMTKEAFDQLIETAIAFKNKYYKDNGGRSNIEFRTKNLVIGTDNIQHNGRGLATELDIIAVNKAEGTIHLLDFKTVRIDHSSKTYSGMLPSEKLTYKNKGQSKADGYAKQQNASRHVIALEYGIEMKDMGIISTEVFYEPHTEVTNIAKMEENPLELDSLTISQVFPPELAAQFPDAQKTVNETQIENDIEEYNRQKEAAEKAQQSAAEENLAELRGQKVKEKPQVNEGTRLSKPDPVLEAALEAAKNGAKSKEKADIEKRRQEELGTKESRSYTDEGGVTATVTITEEKDRKVVRVEVTKGSETAGNYVNTYSKQVSNDKIYEVENAEGYEYTNVKKIKVEGKRADKINAKYDAELAALEPTQQTSEVEVNKADIEKRRQEELKPYEYTLAEVNKMPNGLLRNFLMQANQAINNIKINGGQKLLNYLNINRSSVYDKTAEDNRFKKKQNTIIASDAIDAGLAPNWKVNDLRQAIKLYNSLLSNKEEINAKYDAELAALESEEESRLSKKDPIIEAALAKAKEEAQQIAKEKARPKPISEWFQANPQYSHIRAIFNDSLLSDITIQESEEVLKLSGSNALLVNEGSKLAPKLYVGKNLNDEMLLHELIHAMVRIKMFEIHNDANAQLPKRIARVNSRLLDYYEQHGKTLHHLFTKDEINDIEKILKLTKKNPEELIAYGLSNRAFNKLLKNIPLSGKLNKSKSNSIWSKIAEFLKDIVGIKDSLYDEVIKVIEDNLGDNIAAKERSEAIDRINRNRESELSAVKDIEVKDPNAGYYGAALSEVFQISHLKDIQQAIEFEQYNKPGEIARTLHRRLRSQSLESYKSIRKVTPEKIGELIMSGAFQGGSYSGKSTFKKDVNKIKEINEKYDAQIAALDKVDKPSQKSKEVKTPLKGVADSSIAEMSNENYKELVETGYTQWLDKNGEAKEATYSPVKVAKKKDKPVTDASKRTKRRIDSPSEWQSIDVNGKDINIANVPNSNIDVMDRDNNVSISEYNVAKQLDISPEFTANSYGTGILSKTDGKYDQKVYFEVATNDKINTNRAAEKGGKNIDLLMVAVMYPDGDFSNRQVIGTMALTDEFIAKKGEERLAKSSKKWLKDLRTQYRKAFDEARDLKFKGNEEYSIARDSENRRFVRINNIYTTIQDVAPGVLNGTSEGSNVNNFFKNDPMPIVLGVVKDLDGSKTFEINNNDDISEDARNNKDFVAKYGPDVNFKKDLQVEDDWLATATPGMVAMLVPTFNGKFYLKGAEKQTGKNVDESGAEMVKMLDDLESAFAIDAEYDYESALSAITNHTSLKDGSVSYFINQKTGEGVYGVKKGTRVYDGSKRMSLPSNKQYTRAEFEDLMRNSFINIDHSKLNTRGYNESLGEAGSLKIALNPERPMTNISLVINNYTNTKKPKKVAEDQKVVNKAGEKVNTTPGVNTEKQNESEAKRKHRKAFNPFAKASKFALRVEEITGVQSIEDVFGEEELSGVISSLTNDAFINVMAQKSETKDPYRSISKSISDMSNWMNILVDTKNQIIDMQEGKSPEVQYKLYLLAEALVYENENTGKLELGKLSERLTSNILGTEVNEADMKKMFFDKDGNKLTLETVKAGWEEVSAKSQYESLSDELRIYFNTIPVMKNGKIELDNLGFRKYHKTSLVLAKFRNATVNSVGKDMAKAALEKAAIKDPTLNMIYDDMYGSQAARINAGLPIVENMEKVKDDSYLLVSRKMLTEMIAVQNLSRGGRDSSNIETRVYNLAESNRVKNQFNNWRSNIRENPNKYIDSDGRSTEAGRNKANSIYKKLNAMTNNLDGKAITPQESKKITSFIIKSMNELGLEVNEDAITLMNETSEGAYQLSNHNYADSTKEKNLDTLFKLIAQQPVGDQSRSLFEENSTVVKEVIKKINEALPPESEMSYKDKDNKTKYAVGAGGYGHTRLIEVTSDALNSDGVPYYKQAYNEFSKSSAIIRSAPIVNLLRDNTDKYRDNLKIFQFAALIDENGEQFEYSDMVNTNHYLVSSYNLFFNNGNKNVGRFMTTNLGDSTTATGVQANKFDNVKGVDLLYGVVLQEMARIKEYKSRTEPTGIKEYDQNAEKFIFMPFMNEYLNMPGKSLDTIVSESQDVKRFIFNKMDALAQEHLDNADKRGIKINVQLPAKLREEYSVQGKSNTDSAILKRFFTNFVINDIFTNTQMITIRQGDLAFYKPEGIPGNVSTAYFKRAKEDNSPVQYGTNNPTGKDTFTAGIIQDEEVISKHTEMLYEMAKRGNDTDGALMVLAEFGGATHVTNDEAQPIRNNTKVDYAQGKNVLYKGIEVIDTSDIVSQEGTKGGASFNKENKVIKINRPLLKEKYKDKAWTNPRTLFEIIHGPNGAEEISSKADALPANQFNTYEEFETFVIEHEYQHSLYTRGDFNKDNPNGTKGQYETAINNRALKSISDEKNLHKGKYQVIEETSGYIKYLPENIEVTYNGDVQIENSIEVYNNINNQEIAEDYDNDYIDAVEAAIEKNAIVEDKNQIKMFPDEKVEKVKSVEPKPITPKDGYSANTRYVMLSDGTMVRSSENSTTDGGTYISLDRWRYLIEGQNQFDGDYKRLYDLIKAGEKIPTDLIHLTYEPLKTFFFDNVSYNDSALGPDAIFNRPVQIKDAKFLMTDEIAKGYPELESINNALKNGLDEVSFQSAVKVGSMNVMDINELNDSTKFMSKANTLLSKRTGIQQKTIGKHEEYRSVGTQVAKLMPENIVPGAEYILPDGTSIKGKDLSKMWSDSVIADLEANFMNLTKDFVVDGVDIRDLNEANPADVIKIAKAKEKGMPKLIARLQKKAAELGYGKQFSEYLETGNLSDGLVLETIENIMFAEFKSGLLSLKTPGGMFTNAPSIGYHKDLNIVKNDRGGIEYYEVAMAAPNKEMAELLADENGIINIDENIDILPEELRKAIMYRVPTEHRYSTFNIKVVKYLPSYAGNEVIMPAEATKISGFDFDIDKLYAMFYNYDVQIKNMSAFSKRVNETMASSGLKVGVTPEMIDELSNQSMAEIVDNEDYDAGIQAIKRVIERVKRDVIRDRDSNAEVVFSKSESNMETEKGRANLRLDLSMAIMSSPEHVSQMVSPANYRNMTRISKHYKDKFGISKRNLWVASALTRNEIANVALAGNALKGIASLARTAHAWLIGSGIKLKGMSIDNEVVKRVNNDGTITTTVVSESFREVQSAVYDNQKDPLSDSVNLNTKTADVLNGMLNLGMSLDWAFAVLNSKIMRDVSDYAFLHNMDLSEALTKITKKRQVPKSSDVNVFKAIINGGNKDLSDNPDDLKVSTTLLALALEIGEQSAALINTTQSDTKGAGNFAKAESTANRLNDLIFGELTQIEGLQEWFENTEHPYHWLAQMIQMGLNDTRYAIAFMMDAPFYSPAFMNVKADLKDIKGNNLNEKQTKHVNMALQSAVSSNSKLMPGSIDMYGIMTKLPGEIKSFTKRNPKTNLAALMKKMLFSMPNEKFDYPSIKFDHNGVNPEIMDDVRRKFKDAMTVGYSEAGFDVVTEEEAKLASDLAFYAIGISGSSYSPQSFAQIIPLKFLTDPKAMSDEGTISFLDSRKNQMDMFKNDSTSVMANDFIEDYMRHTAYTKNDILPNRGSNNKTEKFGVSPASGETHVINNKVVYSDILVTKGEPGIYFKYANQLYVLTESFGGQFKYRLLTKRGVPGYVVETNLKDYTPSQPSMYNTEDAPSTSRDDIPDAEESQATDAMDLLNAAEAAAMSDQESASYLRSSYLSELSNEEVNIENIIGDHNFDEEINNKCKK